MSLAGRLSKRFIARKQMFASKISAIYGVMSSVINNTIPALHINSRKEKKKYDQREISSDKEIREFRNIVPYSVRMKFLGTIVQKWAFTEDSGRGRREES